MKPQSKWWQKPKPSWWQFDMRTWLASTLFLATMVGLSIWIVNALFVHVAIPILFFGFTTMVAMLYVYAIRDTTKWK